MVTKVRALLSKGGDIDEALISRIENDWLALDVTKPSSKLTRIESGILSVGVTNLGAVVPILQAEYGLPRPVIAAITSPFGHKAGRQLDAKRRLALGISEAKWSYTNMGYTDGRTCGHEALNGKAFDLRKGLSFQGRFIFPGEEIDCHCMARVSIPGFDSPIKASFFSKIKGWLGLS